MQFRPLAWEPKIVGMSANIPRGRINSLRYPLVNALASTFPPSVTDPRIFIDDQSHWNGSWNINTALDYKNPKLSASMLRTGQGKFSSYDDTRFIEYAQLCIARKHPWEAYHVLVPQQNPIDQVGHLVEIINRLGGVLPSMLTWDIELVNEQSPKTISDRTIIVIEETEKELAIPVDWYSATWYIGRELNSGYMEKQDWMYDESIPYHHAQWLSDREHDGSNLWLPYGFEKKQINKQQTTSNGDGYLFGFSSPRLDFNRWMGSEDKFNDIFGIDEPPIPNGDLENRVERNEQDIAELKSENEYLREKQVVVDEWIESYGTSTT